MIEKLKALVSALPAKLALVQAVLVAAGTVVPLLPLAWQAKAAAILLAATGWVAAAVRVVSKVTPVPDRAEGLVLPPNRELKVELGYLGGEVIQGRVVRR